MRYASTIIYVPDVRAALPYDEEAFGIAAAFVAPDDSYGTTGGLAFARTHMAPTPPRPLRRAG